MSLPAGAMMIGTEENLNIEEEEGVDEGSEPSQRDSWKMDRKEQEIEGTFEELKDGESEDTAFGAGSAFGHLERADKNESSPPKNPQDEISDEKEKSDE